MRAYDVAHRRPTVRGRVLELPPSRICDRDPTPPAVGHWLPKPACDRVLRRLGKGFAGGDYMHLLTKGALRRLLRAAGVRHYRIFANRLAGWPLDFAVFFGGG